MEDGWAKGRRKARKERVGDVTRKASGERVYRGLSAVESVWQAIGVAARLYRYRLRPHLSRDSGSRSVH